MRAARAREDTRIDGIAATTTHGRTNPMDSAEFFARQEGLLRKRQELMASARPHDEEELMQCTCG
jgi:hypothetical protein